MCEADHSPLPSAEIKNEWSYISIPPYAFMGSTGETLFYFSLRIRTGSERKRTH